MERSDSRPSYPARFVVLRVPVTAPCVCVRSARPDAAAGGPELCGEAGPERLSLTDRRRPGLPGSWRTLLCLRPALGPRQDPRTRPRAVRGRGPQIATRQGLL